MKNSNPFHSTFITAILLLAGISGPAYGLDILTEEFPPYNYTRDGKVTGLSTEIVREILKRIDHPDNIKVHSWALAYKIIQKKDNVVLYSTVRSKGRENLFKWVGPISISNLVFFAKKGSGILMKSYDDARKVKSIGVYRLDHAELFLKEKGFNNLDIVLDPGLNPRKLAAGRLSLWMINGKVGVFLAKEAGVLDKIEKVYEIKTDALYLAFSKTIPDAVIDKWQKTLDGIKSDGTYDKILTKYEIRHK
tara:strand:- start:2347 stop:3093 length:747 start_codon:yes stop_codon:yes gene_type:complete